MSEPLPPLQSMRAEAIIGLLPLPVMVVNQSDQVIEANSAAEAFFQTSRSMLKRLFLKQLLPFGSPVLELVQAARASGGS